MAVRLTKPWMTESEAMQRLHGHLGVFQLADADANVLYIGYAGGASRMGLRGEVSGALAAVSGASLVRVEITTAYMSRFRELMMAHIADHGVPPAANPPVNLGKLSPA